MKGMGIMDLDKLKTDLTDFLKDTAYDLYDLEFIKNKKETILRIYIDKLDPITIEDCVEATKLLNPYLDELDPIEHEYILEVSSPGAEKELKTAAAIERAVGKNVYIETYEQKLTGKLVSFNGEYLVLQIKSKTIKIDYIDVNLIRLAIIF
jgi:ribosome maturation factor RimP